MIIDRERTHMEPNNTSVLYKIIKGLVWLFYPKLNVEGTENLPEEAAIIVGNHTQMHGPIACELYSPCKRYTWCAAEMIKKCGFDSYVYMRNKKFISVSI